MLELFLIKGQILRELMNLCIGDCLRMAPLLFGILQIHIIKTMKRTVEEIQ